MRASVRLFACVPKCVRAECMIAFVRGCVYLSVCLCALYGSFLSCECVCVCMSECVRACMRACTRNCVSVYLFVCLLACLLVNLFGL